MSDLEAWFEGCPGALVAFSGGVDSSLVAFLAARFLGRDRALAVISASPSLKLSDLEAARDFARREDLPLEVITTEEMQNPDYFTNPSNRCYFCKHTLYDALGELRARHPGWWVLNGTNTDDLGDYRPGLQAAAEYAVRSPLAETGCDKAAVRALAAHYKLNCWDKPASPCLSSRVPYGQRITLEKLRRIEAAEAVLMEAGFPENRVRHFDGFARVEVAADRLAALEPAKASIEAALLGLGFSSVEFDEEGFVSGKLNRALGKV